MKRSAARIIGCSLIGGALILSGGTEYALYRDGRWAAGLLETPDLSAEIRTNAAYHRAYVERRRRARWHLAGHGILGVLAAAVGIAAVVRSRQRPSLNADV